MIEWWWIAWIAAMLIQRWLQAMLIHCKKTEIQDQNAYVMMKRMLLTLLIY